MNLSLNWLSDFVKIPKSLSAEEIGKSLTKHTVEVEGIKKQSEKFDQVVVGKILEVKKHPNADRLQLALVDVGDEKLNIVCGAPNIEPGQKVPTALVGAILPNGLEIKEAEVRGEKSKGMLCATDELDMGDDHSGIMILDKKARIGTSLGDYLKMNDILLELDNKSLSNRPDLWGHIGIAREISAIYDLKFSQADYNPDKFLNKEISDTVSVSVENKKDCPRYMALAVKNIKIGPSPQWMAERLLAVGMRPINNIVDITNYVMLELGQPMHAFDRKMVDKIVVRRAKKGEVIRTLDDEERTLDEEMLVIADSKNPLAIAGIMGGQDSEISDDTTEIVFESANFDFDSIRKTSTKLSLRTESSARFEKGQDPHNCQKALLRTLELLGEIMPEAEVSSALTDEGGFDLDLGPINFDLEWLEDILGVSFEKKKVVNILEKLGFSVTEKNNSFSVDIPSWRATRDIKAKEDVAEEIARIYGYDNIPSKMPSLPMRAPEKNEELDLIRKVRNILTGLSFSEVYNYSFVEEDRLRKMNLDPTSYIRLANPLNKNQALLRKKLSTNLIQNVLVNQPRYENFSIFEIGSVFLEHAGSLDLGGKSDKKLPYQEKRLGLLEASSEKNNLFRKAKSSIEALAESLGFAVSFCEIDSEPNWADKHRRANIYLAADKGERTDVLLGIISVLDNRVSKKLGIKKEVVVSEFYLNELVSVVREFGEKRYRPSPKYPALLRDLAFVVDKKISYTDILKTIYGFSDYIKGVDLFDVYTGEKIGRENKSLAFSIKYRADKTLRAEEVDEIQKKLLKKMKEEFGAEIRDY